MSDRSYGDILRIAREKSGCDLASMSRRLHIRPDILQAIENSDFDRMPARGYSKNMVRAYARALKLDEQAISDMYLDEVHMHEVGVPRRASSAGRGGTREGARGRSSQAASRAGSSPYRSQQGGAPRRTQPPSRRGAGRTGRELVDSAPVSSRPRQTPPSSARGASSNGREGARRGSRQEPGIGERIALGIGSLAGSIGQGRGRQDPRVPRSFNTIGSTPPYARGSAPSSAPSLSNMNLPMLLAIVAAVIVLIIVVVVVSNGSKQAAEDVPDIPISGLTDTSSPEEGSEPTQTDSAPEFAEFKYSVAEGEKSWVEIYEDGSDTPSFAEVVNGPADASFEVRDTLTLKTPNPAAVKATVDGEEVQFEADSGGYYSYTVDFSEILNQWNIDHGRAAASSSKSSSSSGSSAKSDSSSSSKSSSSSGSKSSSSSSSSKSSRA